MTVDASAIASVLGISSEFVDLREGQALFLPQQIVVLAQGNSSETYPLSKWRALSAGSTAKRFGFGSIAHLAVRELLPANGDGVGTIPVYILPLEDNEQASAAAATGDVTVGGTADRAAEYQPMIGGVLGARFAIPSGAVDVTRDTVALYDAITAVPHMPVTVAFTYDTATGSVGADNTGDGTLDSPTITGTPRPGDWEMVATSATTFEVFDPDGNQVSPDATVDSAYSDNGLSFTISAGTTPFAAGDTATLTVPVTDLQFTAKAKGAWTNDIDLRIIEPDEPTGVTFSFTAMSGGLLDPSVAQVNEALGKIGTQWASMLLNTIGINNSGVLDAIQTFGEGRWGTLEHKPFVSFVGQTESNFAAATAVSSSRSETDRVNSQLVAPGSPRLPAVVAARQLSRIAKQANNDPAVDYVGLHVAGEVPGEDAEQWDYTTRDAAVKAGSSTVEVRGGEVFIGDVVTFYNPEAEQPPGFRFVVDIVRTQNVIYNVWLEFVKQSWAGAPLIPDSAVTTSKSARKPKSATGAVAGIIDGLADAAIVTNREYAKGTIVSTIAGPRRLLVEFTTPYSTNTGVKDIRHSWGFIFG